MSPIGLHHGKVVSISQGGMLSKYSRHDEGSGMLQPSSKYRVVHLAHFCCRQMKQNLKGDRLTAPFQHCWLF